MAKASRFPKVKGPVREFFIKSKQKIFTLEELDVIFRDNFIRWSLSVSNAENFATQLVQSGILKANEFQFEERIKPQIRFWSPETDFHDVALTLIPRGHLSHVTALFLHGIITNPSKFIFITSEQSKKESKTQTHELLQGNIDAAFSKPQRQANTVCKYSGKEIIALNGMFTDKMGIENMSGRSITSIERTLIDITMRPSYGAGVTEVFKAFINAKDKVDVNLLIALLDSIDYTYPYYQSIGFYLERAGYDTYQILKLKERDKFVDFYLDYAIDSPAYSEDWRLFYPKKLEMEFQI